MIRRIILAFMLCYGSNAVTAHAASTSPKVEIVKFTADWCGTCRILFPRLDLAMRKLNDPVYTQFTMDMTKSTRRISSPAELDAFWHSFSDRLTSHGMKNILTGYWGYPNVGYSVVVASDTKEPILCFEGVVSEIYLIERLKEAKTLISTQSPGHRLANDHHCPYSYVS